MTAIFASAIIPGLVRLNAPAPANQDELFTLMATQLHQEGRIAEIASFRAALYQREALGSTYMGHGLALPHGRSATVNQASIVYWHFAQAFDYASAGEHGPVKRAIMLAVPADGADDQLQMLASLARMLLDDELLAALDAATSPEEIVTLLVHHPGLPG